MEVMTAESYLRAIPTLWAARAVWLGVWGLRLAFAAALLWWQQTGVEAWAALCRLGALLALSSWRPSSQ